MGTKKYRVSFTAVVDDYAGDAGEIKETVSDILDTMSGDGYMGAPEFRAYRDVVVEELP